MLTKIIDHYKSLESSYSLTRNVGSASLVTAKDNSSGVDSWFYFKESFSRNLFDYVVETTQLSINGPLRFVDPFAGSGTSLVSALRAAGEGGSLHQPDGTGNFVMGLEVNPVMVEVCRAKTVCILHPEHVLGELDEMRNVVVRQFEAGPGDEVRVPGATLNEERYYSADAARDLVFLGALIGALPDSGGRSVLRVALASAVGATGKLRKDGRALRYVKSKRVAEPLSSFLSFTESMIHDIKVLAAGERCGGEAMVVHGDARAAELRDGYQLSIFSPPYPNNIDYTEVYKVEAYALGFLSDEAELRQQRVRTLRSHPSSRAALSMDGLDEPVLRDSEKELLEVVVESIPSGRYWQQRTGMIVGYFRDMRLVFRRMFDAMAPGGVACFVVGNSTHGVLGEGGFVVAADVLLAHCAAEEGWEVEGIHVLRDLIRRGKSEFARESLVILRKKS
ncbi:hypothetical protein [Serinicoccus sp. CUA-874]|uniref:hypothetical protein n=1 Tax=Serinicoccus sp. CUA-874 TaxID=1517939 RepID=UPI00117ACB02|nr:hypothetical protein [Serinicoccus sp. CUA-874]